MDQKQIDLLTRKIAENSISDEELKAYYNWLSSDDGIPLTIEVAESREELQNRIYFAVAEKAGFNGVPVKKLSLWPRFVAAAAIVIAIMTGGYLYYDKLTFGSSSEILVQNDIAAGSNGAILTLADGKQIAINDALSGNIAAESGVRISKTENGEIMYEVISAANAALAYNTLTTARGQQTQLRLPDGTMVFLNAESSLKYPNNFAASKTRKVFLTGEGFFEVAKDKAHPFIVQSKQQSVEVLGTHFNINAYEDNKEVKTTLLEGSVRVSSASGYLSKLLNPGQQAKVSENVIDVVNVETEDAVAWKNGRIMYEEEPLENIMNDVARWYNVQVVYKNEKVKDKTFFVSISRKDNVSTLLKLLMKTSAVTFEIKGNQIIVDQKNE